MENTNKKFWFFGSKHNTALLAILIILMISAIRIMLEDKEKYFPLINQEQTSPTVSNPQ